MKGKRKSGGVLETILPVEFLNLYRVRELPLQAFWILVLVEVYFIDYSSLL